ncbi:MAG: GNAT family N-acetyltransferase [candidate division WOR-3 bacterium]|nr:GNAT family N-acetyltransferase [candidate division WOR-3 bacterium]
MNQSVNIREATEKDVKQICKIARQVLNIVTQHRPEFLGRLVELQKIDRFYLNALKEKNSAVLVAEKQNKIIGYAYITIERKPDDLIAIPYLSINELVVDEKYRGQGIGTSLMKRIFQWAKRKKLKVLQLAVWEFNQKTIKFYQKFGFKTIMRKMEKVL